MILGRRAFLTKGLAAAGSLVFSNWLGDSPAGAATSRSKFDKALLQSKFGFKGKVLAKGEAGFEEAAIGTVWNELRPTRRPELIAQVTDEQDVAAAVKFAKANNLKVTVRGGGHNWAAPSLRNRGMLIDLTNLNKVISIDPVARKAVVQPIISNRDVQKALNAQGMSYPSGHCPPVKLSGYLLSGGMAWNQGEWGPGVGSIEAIEIVTSEGEMITASATENQDYFWAARGAGPGFFGVAVRYHLKLYPLPTAITASVYQYPYEHLIEIAEWLGPLAAKLPANVELSLFAVQAPPELAEKAKSSGGKICMVTATMFTNSLEEAKKTLCVLDTCPVRDKALMTSLIQPTTFEQLFDGSGDLWPGNLRCKVDAMFSDAPLSELFKSTKDHFEKSTSPETVLMFAIFTGPNVPAPLPDAAFSQSARLYGGPWTMWKDAASDAQQIAWHEKCVALLKPHIIGHYISESDTSAHPEYSTASFSAAKWKKLAELRKKYDPTGVFFNFTEALS